MADIINVAEITALKTILLYVVQVQAVQMRGESDQGRASYVEGMYEDCREIVSSTATIDAPQLTPGDKERLLGDVLTRIDEFFAGLEN